MRRILLLMLPILLLCTALTANAAENEFKLGASASSRFNDNTGNVGSGDKESSFSFDVGPTVQFDSSDSRFEVGATYSPRFATYTNQNRKDHVRHSMAADAEFRPDERWTLKLRDALTVDSDSDRDRNLDTQADLDGGGEKQTLRNSLNGSVRYRLSPIVSVYGSSRYRVTLREDADLSDNSQVSGQFGGNYVAGAKDTFGLGSTIRHKTGSSSNANAVANSRNDYYGFFVSWDRRFTPLLGLNASGGPTWVVSKRQNVGASTKRDFDYFANVQLFSEFDGGSTSISYQRSGSDLADTSTEFFIDAVSVTADYAATRKIVLGVRGEWSQRTGISKFTRVMGSTDRFVDKVLQWRATGSLSYRLTKELVTRFSLDYLRQDASDEDAIDRYRVSVRFIYNAQTFHF